MVSQATAEMGSPAPEAMPTLDRAPAEWIVDWLDATSFIRDTREHVRAAQAFARVVRKRGAEPTVVEAPSRETLRLARVRLDVVAMLLHRRLFAQCTNGPKLWGVAIYLYCDASPQWRGTELFAASIDFVDIAETYCRRRLLPVVSLDRGLYDALGKTFALLWQLMLVVGPSWVAMKKCCHRVRGLLTDLGVERLIWNQPDVLRLFFDVVGCPVRQEELEEALVEQHLFPKCIHMPGWKHTVDNVLQKGLCSMVFFPKFLARFKAVLALLRRQQVKVALARRWRGAGQHAIADMLLATNFPGFAHWRWQTLWECTKALSGLLDTLAAQWDPALLKNARDSSEIGLVNEALRSPCWHKQFAFVSWYCDWLGPVTSWISGCDCHQAALLRGETIACWKKADGSRRQRNTCPANSTGDWQRQTLGHPPLGGWMSHSGRMRRAECVMLSIWRP